MEPAEIQQSSHREIHSDIDILSPQFQVEATAYLQPVAIAIVIGLLLKRSRLFVGARFMDFKPSPSAVPPAVKEKGADDE